MGNLYEHTLILEQIKDLIILDGKGKPSKEVDFKDKLTKLPDFANPIDNPNTVFWWVDDQIIEKKSE